jgi:hypothetical protein
MIEDLERKNREFQRRVEYLENKVKQLRRSVIYSPVPGADISRAAVEVIAIAKGSLEPVILTFNGVFIPIVHEMRPEEVVEFYHLLLYLTPNGSVTDV